MRRAPIFRDPQQHRPEARFEAGGHVRLIGAGPGDPELLTLKACKALQEADVILHDRLVDTRILEFASRRARLIEVGKSAGGASWGQDNINALMIGEARAGRRVARLKSGDPLVFARADEEMAALQTAGISYDIIPGITSGVAAAAALKASLTRRDRNSAISFLTAHDLAGFAEHDWTTLARPGTAAAIYMGVRAARFVQGRLMLHGARPDTPIAVVENVTRPGERIARGWLSALSELIEQHGIKGPAIIFIGVEPPGVAAEDRSARAKPAPRAANL